MKDLQRGCCLLLAVCLLAGLLSGCAGETAVSRRTEDGRVALRVSMYNASSYPAWRAYVEAQCPEIYIQWENNRNTAANVLYLAEHGDMPDIVAIRRFEYDTAAQLQPYLADLGGLAVTAAYEPQYLEPFARGGRQYWLPGPGTVDGMVANVDLFNQYGIPLPTDLPSFFSACRRLEANGVDPFAADCAEPWTPTQLLEGFGAPILTSGAGAEWLKSFIAGKTTGVDEGSFARLTAVIRMLRSSGVLTGQDMDTTAADANAAMISGRAAIVRKNSDEKYDPAGTHRYAALPFFGTTAADSWLCTYPVFSLALSDSLRQDADAWAAAKQLLSVMLSPAAQLVLNSGGEGLISYSRSGELPLSDALAPVRELIGKDRCLIRALNANSFRANALALSALLREGADDRRFFNVFNETLFQAPSAVKVAVSALAADNAADSDMCSPAASVAAQVLRRQTGADCALIDVREIPSAIYKGNYTEADICAVVADSAVYTGTVTRKQLIELLDDCILCATTFVGGGTEPVIDYPALAGMQITMQQDGTVLGVEVSGAPREKQTVFRIALSGNLYAALSLRGSSVIPALHKEKQTLRQFFSAGFRAEKLPQPQHYFTVR